MLFLQSHHQQPFQYQTHTAEEQQKKEKEEEEEGEEGLEQEMREEEDHAKWFSRWEEQLPPPEELTPLNQTLITADLALAFDITPNRSPPPPSSNHPPQQPPPSSDFVDSAELGSGAGSDEPARTLKRPRLVWTPQLHKRFVDAVAHLGIKNAVPKTIMQLMSVDGLTRENVASHLQKYRLYLKRMQGLSAGGGAAGGGISAADAAADHLFASAPVPHHFLHRGGGGGGGPTPPPPAAGGVGGEHYLPFVPVAAALQHHHHQQMAAVVAAAHQHQQFQRQLGHFGSPPAGQFEHGFLARQQPAAMHRLVGAPVPVTAPVGPAYIEDLESGGGGGGGRKVLTLFPTAED